MSAQHTLGPWRAVINRKTISICDPDGNTLATVPVAVGDIAAYKVETVRRRVKDAALMATAPELLAYAQCEEARTMGETIAGAVLKIHGFDPTKCTAHEFMDRMRRAAIAKAT